MTAGGYEDYAAAALDGMSVAHAAALDPDRVAVISEYGNRTFGELNANVNRIVRVLREAGVAYGERVALLCRNRAEFVEVAAATAQAGGYWLTAVNWHLTPDEVNYVVEDSGSKALFIDASIPCAAGVADTATAPLLVSIAGKLPRCTPYEDLLDGVDGSNIENPRRGSTMLYTSGTTGRPKGVYREYVGPPGPNITGYDETTSHLVTGPLYHAAPLLISLYPPLMWGASVILMDGWTPAETLRLIHEHKVTHSHMVPTMFNRLIGLPDDVKAKADTSSLRIVLHGAAPCPVHVKQQMMDWFGPIIWEYYAATEGSATLVDPQTWLAHPGTVGKTIAEDGIIIRDDDGNECPAGVPGTVWIKTTPGAEFEYYGDKNKTAESVVDTHFTLGDVGYLDEERYLFLTDRSANLIISGGVNIYPAEVDAVLLEHPAVGDVAVIGVPDDDMGESVKAVVELRDGVAPSPELSAEIIAFARERIAHFKCPRTVDFIDKLPREDNGKIYKRRLREQYRDATQETISVPINPDAVGTTGTAERSWTSKDALLYAVGVGAGATDPLQELQFTTENSRDIPQQVLPTFAVIIGGGAPVMRSIGEFNFAMLLHGEQAITLHNPIPVEGTVKSTSTISAIWDKGKGAVVETTTQSVDAASGQPLFDTRSAAFIRGEGDFGGERGPSGDTNVAPDRKPDQVVSAKTRDDQALTYRLSGDRNPLHSDPTFAAAGGFDRPILHGLCTYGFTGRLLLNALCGGDPAKFGGIEGRFKKPVLPGQELVVSIWNDDDGAIFQTSVDGAVVIDGGRVTLRG